MTEDEILAGAEAGGFRSNAKDADMKKRSWTGTLYRLRRRGVVHNGPEDKSRWFWGAPNQSNGGEW